MADTCPFTAQDTFARRHIGPTSAELPEMLAVCGFDSLEALCHSAHPWTDETHDRLATFTCFDTVNQKWGTERTPHTPSIMIPMRLQM